MKKILIVDDDEKIHKRFSSYLADENLEILLAKNISEASGIAQDEMPSAATIDFYLGPAEPDGNSIGAELRKINPEIRIAGITYGDPENFDENVFDIRESKGIDRKTYVNIVSMLLNSDNPGENYSASQQKDEIPEQILAASILLQGYNTARNLQKGIQPAERIELPAPSDEKTLDILNFEGIGLNPMEVYAAMCRVDHSIAGDSVAENFFKAIDDKRYSDIKDADAEHVEKRIAGIISAAYRD